eukprot:scaffold48791_cov14-Tisochrysis_lutea.AAC.1
MKWLWVGALAKKEHVGANAQIAPSAKKGHAVSYGGLACPKNKERIKACKILANALHAMP